MAVTASTIFALSSGHGRAGIAVIRVSGPRAGHALEALAGRRPRPRFASLRKLRAPGTSLILDEALVLFFPAPKSETGEDMAELHVHGGRAVIEAVLGALGGIEGCRMAEPGEFARRAFENGKLDLTALEGLADLIDAETETQRAQAVAQAGGALTRIYDGMRKGILEAQALVEASIDFSDEDDVSMLAIAEAEASARSLRGKIEQHLAGAHRGEIIRDGYQVVLAGPPNVGKSSLLNALSRRDAAIVAPEAGTTRDVIEVRLDLGGLPVVISDTAGIRTAEGAVEQEGIRRTLAAAARAELVLWLGEAGSAPLPPPRFSEHAGPAPAVATVLTKADLVEVRGEGSAAADFVISAVTGAGIDALTAGIAARARAAIGTRDEPVPTQVRYREHLLRARAHLGDFLQNREAGVELRAEDLRRAADEIGRITGRIDAEAVLGAIFGRFCIGK